MPSRCPLAHMNYTTSNVNFISSAVGPTGASCALELGRQFLQTLCAAVIA